MDDRLKQPELRTCDALVESYIADGQYQDALDHLVRGYQRQIVSYCRNIIARLHDAIPQSRKLGAYVAAQAPDWMSPGVVGFTPQATSAAFVHIGTLYADAIAALDIIGFKVCASCHACFISTYFA